MDRAANITKRRPGATTRARRLRREETDAERRLWYRLSGRVLAGHKFVRQVPLGPYVVDFLCRSERLVVELDGEQHIDSRSDERRTVFLNKNGYSVLRFWNHEVLREREAVLDAILAVLEGKISSPSPGLRFAPADLSPEGRGTVPCPTATRRSQPSSMPDGREGRGLAAGSLPLPSGERSPQAVRRAAGEGVERGVQVRKSRYSRRGGSGEAGE